MELRGQAIVVGDESSATHQGLRSTRFARAFVWWIAGLLLGELQRLRAVLLLAAQAQPARQRPDRGFDLLLPETQGDRAQGLADRLRELFAGTVVALGDGSSTTFTASFGVAVRSGATSLEDLLRASDAALYSAKHGGRDRVVSATAATFERTHSPAASA